MEEKKLSHLYSEALLSSERINGCLPVLIRCLEYRIRAALSFSRAHFHANIIPPFISEIITQNFVGGTSSLFDYRLINHKVPALHTLSDRCAIIIQMKKSLRAISCSQPLFFFFDVCLLV